MIILSVGMPRAGSGWHYNLIHGLMKTTGSYDAREIREKYRLQNILTEVNCNIGVLSLRRLTRVMIPSLLGKTFVIKAHAGPTIWSRLFTKLGLLRVTYIYRDPRDAMISAYDYGQRVLKNGRTNVFSQMRDFDESIDFMKDYIRIWEKWQSENDVLIARYEDLLREYDTEAFRLVEFLKLDGSRPEVQKVIEAYRPGKAEGKQGTHFHKGKVGRFRESYSTDQQKVMENKFGSVLVKMRYEI